jgi:hypothetical protein
MQIVGQALYVISRVPYAFKEALYSVVNRIALDIFTTYHWVMHTEKSDEIEKITKAIEALENKQPATELLSKFKKDVPNLGEKIEDDNKKLLEALNQYRYGVINLYRGLDLEKNYDVCYQIANYLEPPNSTSRTKTEAPPPEGNLKPRDLSKEFE